MEYREAVKQCKFLLKQRSELKYEIVKMALSVCIIKEGNNSSHRNYTLTAFAKDIGIPKGTLSRWKLEYENVIVKVGGKGKNFKLNPHALNNTMREVNSKTPKNKVNEIYKKYSTGYNTPEDKTLNVYNTRLRSMHFFICYGSDLSKLNSDELALMEHYCKDMLKCLKTKKTLKTKKPLATISKAIRLTTQPLH